MVRDMNTFSSIDEATYFMRNSKFCLAPAGDAPSFTQRFASAIVSGCIPIHIDPYIRQPQTNVSDIRLPFFRQINWTNNVLIITPDELHKTVQKTKHNNYAIHNSLRRRIKFDLMLKDASQSAIDEIHMILRK